jgi:ribosome biogenesis GTPase / thiamine phosphate phosphatase
MFLEHIGADDRVRGLFRLHEGEGVELGRVCFATREQYRILFEHGESEAAPSGTLRWEGALPAVGDWVAARRVNPEFALIEAVLPRRTTFSRRAAGDAVAEQVIAANVDLAVVVCGLDGDFNLRRLERYLVLVKASGAEALFVLNKADLCSVSEERAEAAKLVVDPAPLVVLSAHESVESLRAAVRGRTVALLGSSGVGKSTIVNQLLLEKRQATAEVREADSRGRHTTTSRILIALPGGGAIIDNPGMRELQLWASEESLGEAFPDVAALAEHCKFGDCTHTTEPDCAVRAALESDQLDSSRWRSYRKLQAETRHQHIEQDARAKAEQKRKWKISHKAMRHHPKYSR